MPFDLLGGIKARREERRRLQELFADRIPPGQELTEKWPVLHYGSIPRFDPKSWAFEVTGLVGNPIMLSYQQFMALPKVEVVADMHCVTGWSKMDNRWEGVSFQEIVRAVAPKPEATHVVVHCYGGYTTNLPLSVLMSEDVLLAYGHNGENLAPDHGWPLRLVVPQRYAWKSAKWVQRLDFLDHDERGFWENYGYHNNAEYWKEERYSWQEE